MIDTDERSRVRENNPLPAFRIEYTVNEEKKEKRSNNIIPSTIIAKHETRLVSVNKYDNKRLLKHLEKYPSHLRTIICYVSFAPSKMTYGIQNRLLFRIDIFLERR